MAVETLKALLQISASGLHEKEDDDFYRFHMHNILSTFNESILEGSTSTIVNAEMFNLSSQCLVNFCSGVHQADLTFDLFENENKRTSFIKNIVLFVNNRHLKESTKGVLLSVLCNLSRSAVWTSFISKNIDMTDFNFDDMLEDKNKDTLVSMFLLNMTSDRNFRKHLVDTKLKVFDKIINLFEIKQSESVMGVVAGILKNCLFDDDTQLVFLNTEVDMLAAMLKPLCDAEDVIDEEDRQKLPKAVEILSGHEGVKRIEYISVKKTILEAFMQVCSTSSGREYLRSHGVYFIIREMHKAELKQISSDCKPKREMLYLLEQVVDQLICKEDDRPEKEKSLRDVELPEKVAKLFEDEETSFIEGKSELLNSQKAITE